MVKTGGRVFATPGERPTPATGRNSLLASAPCRRAQSEWFGSLQAANETGAALRRTRVQCLVGCGTSAVCEFDEHVGVAALRRAPAHEVLAAQLVQRRHERRLPHNPCAVFRDHLIARAVAVYHERVAPFARATDVNAIWRRA